MYEYLKKNNIIVYAGNILNNKTFLPGAGDGAEKPFHFDCNYNTLNIYDDLEEDSLCIAAHPFNSVPLLQWLFFKRGNWEKEDIIPFTI